MSTFGDSPLSEAPPSHSPTRSTGTGSPAKPPPSIKIKETQKKPQSASASSSRRSSRIEDRSVSPEKPVAPRTSLKIKVTRPPSPEKLSEIIEEAQAGLEQVEEKGKRGKKRKSESWTEAEGEVREAIANGKKKVKVSHEEEEPKKKNVAIVKKSSGGVGEKSATDMISDLFGDDDDDDEEEEVVAKEKKEVVKPVIKIKGKPGRKSKIEQDAEGDIKMDNYEEVVEKTSKLSKSKARRREDEDIKHEVEPTIAPSKSASKRTKRETIDEATIPNAPAAEPTISASKSTSKRPKRDTANEETIPNDTTTETEPTVKALKPKGRPRKPVEAEDPSTSTFASASVSKVNKKVEPPPAPETDTKPTKEDPKSTPATEKPKKSFAQVVAGSPPPSEKREKKPLPTITKLNKPFGSTPDTRVQSASGSGSGSGTGTNTPTVKKLPPPQKKKEVSLLESTMASLLGGGKSTPKKEEKETPKSTPKPVVKERVKGSWADEWVLTPAQQREVLESRDERDEERRKRMLYRRNPVNLQEAKDSYRLDSTKTRVIPTLPYPHGGLGVKTEGAPSMMLRALIERNTQSASQSQSQSQSV